MDRVAFFNSLSQEDRERAVQMFGLIDTINMQIDQSNKAKRQVMDMCPDLLNKDPGEWPAPYDKDNQDIIEVVAKIKDDHRVTQQRRAPKQNQNVCTFELRQLVFAVFIGSVKIMQRPIPSVAYIRNDHAIAFVLDLAGVRKIRIPVAIVLRSKRKPPGNYKHQDG